jgi:hypothetical protein
MGRHAQIQKEGLQRPHRRREAKTPGDQETGGCSRESLDPHVRVQHTAPDFSRARPVFAQFAPKSNRSVAIAAGFSCLALFGAAPSHADGVVMEAAAGFARGDVVASGKTIKLAKGEKLVVLDRSGRIITMAASGIYGDVEPEKAPSVSFTRAVAGDLRRADLGGTRADDLEACLKRGDLTAEQCSRAQAKASDDTPRLKLGPALRTASLKPKDPLLFKLESNFPATVICGLGETSPAATVTPMDLQAGRHELRLMQNVVSLAPQRGGPRLTAPAAPGDYRISCWAFSTTTWDALRAATAASGDFAEDLKLARSFAAVREEPMAEGSFQLRVDG